MLPNTANHKVGRNRGNARVWLEGKNLLSRGITCKTPFSCEIRDDKIILRFGVREVTRYGKRTGVTHRRVAGTPQRPIIDMNGGWLTEFFGGATEFIVLYESAPHQVTIKPKW